MIFSIAVHISGCDSGACVCCASFECVGMCKYDDANVLFYACWFARRQMLGRRYRVSLEQLGALCGGCVCQRWDCYIYICIMY